MFTCIDKLWIYYLAWCINGHGWKCIHHNFPKSSIGLIQLEVRTRVSFWGITIQIFIRVGSIVIHTSPIWTRLLRFHPLGPTHNKCTFIFPLLDTWIFLQQQIHIRWDDGCYFGKSWNKVCQKSHLVCINHVKIKTPYRNYFFAFIWSFIAYKHKQTR